MSRSVGASAVSVPRVPDPGDAGFDQARATECARWLAPGCALAAVCLGVALQQSNGFLHPTALRLVALAYVLVIVAVVVPRPSRFARVDRSLVELMGLAGLALHLGYLFTSVPGVYLRLAEGDFLSFQWGLVGVAVVGASLVRGAPRWVFGAQVALLVAMHFALGVWVIERSPDPVIDVYRFHRIAIDGLRSGIDPYGLTFPDLYPATNMYGPGLSVNGRLQFGFPYFPLSLLVAMPGQIVAGDPRYAQLVAIELAAVLMAFARRGGLGSIAAVLYLTTPRIFFVLEQSWTEPFLVLGVSAVVFAACRDSRWLPWAFGAFIGLKQYLVFALPAVALLLGRRSDRHGLLTFLLKATMLATAVTLPFFVWNPRGFWRSVVTLQFHQPFRPDALSFLASWVSSGHEQPPVLVAFVVAGAASALALWRLPRTPAGFGAAVGLTLFTFFVFNKQAFCNYYFFVVGTLCASVAAWHAPDPSP